jgi:hypothetical protein
MRSKEKNNSRGSVQFEKHEPERRSGTGSNLFCNGGCCCCCCCLHSLGGLIGAAMASAKGKSQSEAGPVVGTYWALFALVAAGGAIWGSAQAGGPGLGIILVLVFLPLVQLLASLLTMIWVGVRREAFPDKQASLTLLGKITLYSFLGALAGIVAMMIGFKMFS